MVKIKTRFDKQNYHEGIFGGGIIPNIEEIARKQKAKLEKEIYNKKNKQQRLI